MCGWFAGTFRRDFCRTLHMFGMHHCCYSSSSCLSETCELAPALAGAERRTFLIDCAICALRSASRRSVSCCDDLEDTPNHCERTAANTRRRDRKLAAIRGWLPTRQRQQKLSLHASIKPWSIRHFHSQFCGLSKRHCLRDALRILQTYRTCQF